MAYQGWLIKVGDYTIPMNRFIKADAYSVTRNTQDIDSYTDANGKLHRDVVEYVADKVEFETPAMLTDLDMEEFQERLFENYTDKKERKANVTLYVPEIGQYVTQEMYVVNQQYKIYGTYGGRIHYNSIRFAFVSYGVEEVFE